MPENKYLSHVNSMIERHGERHDEALASGDAESVTEVERATYAELRELSVKQARALDEIKSWLDQVPGGAQ